MLREIADFKEETGLDVDNVKFIMHQEFIFDPMFWKRRHFIFLDFACKSKSTEVRLNSEGQEYVWANPQAALKLSIEPYTRIAMQTYLKQQ